MKTPEGDEVPGSRQVTGSDFHFNKSTQKLGEVGGRERKLGVEGLVWQLLE